MTIDAASLRLAERDVGPMTSIAANARMRPIQPIIRIFMLEYVSVELNDISAAPFVVGVAVVAVLFRRFRMSPVKTASRRAVRGRILVAIETQPRLRTAGIRLVAKSDLWERHYALYQKRHCRIDRVH